MVLEILSVCQQVTYYLCVERAFSGSVLFFLGTNSIASLGRLQCCHWCCLIERKDLNSTFQPTLSTVATPFIVTRFTVTATAACRQTSFWLNTIKPSQSSSSSPSSEVSLRGQSKIPSHTCKMVTRFKILKVQLHGNYQHTLSKVMTKPLMHL